LHNVTYRDTAHTSYTNDTAARDMQQPTQPSAFTEPRVHSAHLGLHNTQTVITGP